MDLESLGCRKAEFYPCKVSHVEELKVQGPWRTKSEANLRKLIELDYEKLQDFLSYEQSELDVLPVDIRGLRSYTVFEVKQGSLGAMEFHRCRKELLFVLRGKFEVECEDVYGDKKIFFLDSNNGVFIKPFIFHAYKCVEDGDLIVICNTQFDTSNTLAQDHYNREVFEKLQKHY